MKRIQSTQSDLVSVALTVYNEGFGTVREERKIALTGQEHTICYEDVAEKMETNSLLVEGLTVKAFNYQYDLVNRLRLYEKYIDHTVTLVSDAGQKGYRLLSVEEESRLCVLQELETGTVTLRKQEELVLPALVDGLRARPALIWEIVPTVTESMTVSYLTGGLYWTADYVLAIDEGALSLAGWATIKNESGRTYENAVIKLIAGEVYRAEEKEMSAYLVYSSSPGPEEAATERAFSDYHLYTFKEKATLNDRQTKQIQISSGQDIQYERYYALADYGDAVTIRLSIENIAKNHLGIPLPAGTVKVYEKDPVDQTLTFIGEDRIDHTPVEGPLDLTLGEAFDVTFDHNTVDTKKHGGLEWTKRCCTIRNQKTDAIKVHFRADLPVHAEVTHSTHPYEKNSAAFLDYWVEVKALSEVKVVYAFERDRSVTVAFEK